MSWKNLIAATAIVSLVSVLTLALVEGFYSVARWDRMDESITLSAYRAIKRSLKGSGPEDADGGLPLLTRQDFEAALPMLERANAGLGNTPYTSLASVNSAINVTGAGGCLGQKPDLRKIMVPLRTAAFELFDPPNLFVDETALADDAMKQLLDRYGGTPARLTTNAEGERTTLPAVTAARKVLVAGDSVANGTRLDDADTLASQLQAADAGRRYVNLGVGGARAADVLCRLEDALARYRGSVDAIVYVYCENDFDAGAPFGTPAAAVEKLATLVREAGVGHVTVVYAPYLYNIVPHLSRFRGYRGDGFPSHAAEANALADAVAAAGFRFIDIRAMAAAEARAGKTDFAVLGLFADAVHLSVAGTARLAQLIRNEAP